MKWRQFISTFGMIVLLLALAAACSPSAPTVPPPPTKPAQPTASATTGNAPPTTASTPTSRLSSAMITPATVAVSTAGARPIVWPERAGLDELGSYRFTLRRSFKGTQNGQAAETSTTYTRSYRKDPPAQFTSAETTGADGKPVKLLFGYIGAVAYQQAAADQPCTAATKSAGVSEWNPGAALRPVTQGKLIGAETVNGVPSQHYALDASSMGKGWTAETSGDLYLAEPGGYVVKYVLRVKAGETYFGKGSQGEETVAFEVLSASEAAEIALPPGCPQLANIPSMADASDVTRTPWGTSYLTASTVAQVLAYYRTQMQTAGWELRSSSEDAVAAAAALAQVAGPGAPQTTSSIAPNSTGGWMLFANSKENKVLYLTVKQEGTKLRVQAQIDNQPQKK